MTDRKPTSKKPDDGSNPKGVGVPRKANTTATPPKVPGVTPTPKTDDGTSQRGSNVPRGADTRPGGGGAGTPR